jgi:hypothetical protein
MTKLARMGRREFLSSHRAFRGLRALLGAGAVAAEAVGVTGAAGVVGGLAQPEVSMDQAVRALQNKLRHGRKFGAGGIQNNTP